MFSGIFKVFSGFFLSEFFSSYSPPGGEYCVRSQSLHVCNYAVLLSDLQCRQEICWQYNCAILGNPNDHCCIWQSQAGSICIHWHAIVLKSQLNNYTQQESATCRHACITQHLLCNTSSRNMGCCAFTVFNTTHFKFSHTILLPKGKPHIDSSSYNLLSGKVSPWYISYC